MTSTHLLIQTIFVALLLTPAQECREWQECRQMALDAAAKEDYNSFHDLSWRALQLGPKNDPALMTMLARAQSMSGRPGDALVMLQRLLSLGVKTDADTNNDFERVRALPAWPEFEARMKGATAAVVPPTAPNSTSPAKPATPKPAETTDKKADTTDKKSERPTAPKPRPAEPSPTAPSDPPAPRDPAAPISFSSAGLSPIGLGYDSVSGRFILADSRDRRLLVVGERSGRLSSLVGIDAGFDQVSAFEIDSVEGDLWVVSSSSQPRSTLHKLQLISGRILSSIVLGPEEGPGRFTDVAVTPQSILVLDGEGRRVYRVAKKGRTLDMAVRLPVEATSLAPAADGVAYASYDRGLLRVDLTSRALTVVEPARDVDLGRLRWIRWHRAALIATQDEAGGTYRVMRLRFDDAGRRVRGADVLASGLRLASPTSVVVSGGTLYYLHAAAAADQLEVRKLPLK
jgi:hypothetical protein